jgi:hypothetical protein
MFGLPFGILYGLGIDFKNIDIYSFVVPILFVIFVLLRQRYLIHNLSISLVKLGHKEAVSTGFKGLPSWYIYLLYAFSLSMLGFGIYLHFTKSESQIGLIAIGASLICFILAVAVQKMKKI